MKIIANYLSLIILLVIAGCRETPDYDKVGYAPPEAFEEGSEYPYYGSFTPEGFIKTAFTASNKNLYKRHGQKQILEIVRGNPEEAVRLCSLKLAEYPDDSEFMYTLSIAQCQLGDLDEAVKTMEKALAKGLPFERFLAGPRDLLRPLAETETYKKLAAQYENKLIHGPLLGSVTSTSAKFWVRTAVEKPVQVRISRSNNLTNPIESEVKGTDANEDYTTILEISGLQPATTYYYDVTVDGQSELGQTYPSFRTYSADGENARFKVAFGGGAGYVPEHERMWDVINSHDPMALLLMGDNVYLDLPEAVNGFHYYTYYRRQSRPEFRRLTSSTSVYAI